MQSTADKTCSSATAHVGWYDDVQRLAVVRYKAMPETTEAYHALVCT